MNLELTKTQMRRLLDLVYIGNWVLNSVRGDARFADYDNLESLLFEKAGEEGFSTLSQLHFGERIPSKAFVEGGIHNAIAEYEGCVFLDILAEDLARRDMGDVDITPRNYGEFISIVEKYMEEFEVNGTDNLHLSEEF